MEYNMSNIIADLASLTKSKTIFIKKPTISISCDNCYLWLHSSREPRLDI